MDGGIQGFHIHTSNFVASRIYQCFNLKSNLCFVLRSQLLNVHEQPINYTIFLPIYLLNFQAELKPHCYIK